jgi:translation initiation factor IF-2
MRDGIETYAGVIAGLKRFKEDTREVAAGFECGIKIENFDDLKEGDIIETFIIHEIAQKLDAGV